MTKSSSTSSAQLPPLPQGESRGEDAESPSGNAITAATIDAVDRRIIIATQAGLPRVPRPYHKIAEELALTPDEVMARLARMQETGVIRRIGAVPNHYKLGFKGNGMSVWDVPDSDVRRLGRLIGALEYVSHCYHRPRHLPHWPYNLFAMVHGQDREQVMNQVQRIANLLGDAVREHDVLFSTRILKKTGMRLLAE
ncbi:MAG: AsnC family transcriptional regulator [Gammaproteobacteria bacterium]|nr:AsnC family transcriptional regulator [Gammaproteobacteria bacterium]MBU2477919.1 AsnC family transcriptional regulator [Gammaproteobacteria bacterium]